MSETPAPHPPRLPAWHPAHLIGAWRQRERPGDEKIRKKSGRAAKATALGMVATFLTWATAELGGVLRDHRQAVRDLPGAVAAAIKERDAATMGDAAWVVSEVRALREETALHQAADATQFSRLEGVVAGRWKCAPCPVCKPCPPPPPADPTTRWQRDR